MADDTQVKRTQISVEIDTDIKDAMDSVKDAEGTPLAFQIRYALLAYLETKGINLGHLKPQPLRS